MSDREDDGRVAPFETGYETPELENPRATLAGLFTGRAKLRKPAYLIYATLTLVVSFGPDLVTYQIVAGAAVGPFTAYISVASSILLKIGTALGFVAAANTEGIK